MSCSAASRLAVAFASGQNADVHQDLAKHRVVALVPSRVAVFELGIVAEVFGLERPELDVPWWYSLTVCAERPGLVAAGAFAVQIDHGLEALRGADTVIVPGWSGEPPAALLDALRAFRGRVVVDLQRGLPPRRRGPARRPGGGDALALRRRAGRSGIPTCASTPTCSTSTAATC